MKFYTIRGNYYSSNNDEVIIICLECFIYFTSLLSPTDFCFRELRKCYRKVFVKRSGNSISGRIRTISLSDSDKKKLIRGEI